ncbi:MAG: hypothetical protein WCK98_06945 [bacterium]
MINSSKPIEGSEILTPKLEVYNPLTQEYEDAGEYEVFKKEDGLFQPHANGLPKMIKYNEITCFMTENGESFAKSVIESTASNMLQFAEDEEPGTPMLRFKLN